MIRVNRDQFLEQGYLILRGVIQPQDLEILRRSYENLVDRQREIWSEEAARGVATADVWQSSPQPRLNITRTPDLGDRETSPVFEFWLRENIQGVSSVLLAEDDVPPTEMMLMCNPVRDHGPAQWHRDFYPPLNCPLMAYVDDILENGPRYVQWNVPLYDDSVLWVVPGSHVRRNATPRKRTRPCRKTPGRRFRAVCRPTSARVTGLFTSCPSSIGVATTPRNYAAPCTAVSRG